MRLTQLRNLLNVSRLMHRNYSFAVNLNVKAIDSIEVLADKTFGPNRKIGVQVYDSHGQLQNGSQLNIMQSEEGFFLNYSRSEDDKLVVSLPLTARLTEYDVRVTAEKSNVTVNNLLMRSLSVKVNRGNVEATSLRLENIDVSTADNIKTQGLFGPQLAKIELNSSDGDVNVMECRTSELIAIGRKVHITNCFCSINKIKSSVEAIIMNLLGSTKIYAEGDKFELNGFAGTITALLGTRTNHFEFLMLNTDDNEITMSHPDATCFMAFSNQMARRLTKILLHVRPDVITQTAEDFTLSRMGERLFEIVRPSGGDGESTLNVIMGEGKELRLHRRTWMDNFKWIKQIFEK